MILLLHLGPDLLRRDVVLVLEVVRLESVLQTVAGVDQRPDDLIELMSLGDYRNKFVSELSTGSRRIVDLA